MALHITFNRRGGLRKGFSYVSCQEHRCQSLPLFPSSGITHHPGLLALPCQNYTTPTPP
jgi:hypothetical protein